MFLRHSMKFKMSRKSGLTMEKIITLLRELSDNEWDSGELWDMHDEFDDENIIPVVTSRSENDDSEIDDSQNQNELVACDGSQWNKCASGSVTSKLATQNILQRNSGPTSYIKRNVNNDTVLSVWLLFQTIVLEHIAKCTNTEACWVLASDALSLSKDEFFTYISILYIHGVSRAMNLEFHSLGSTTWYKNFWKETMSRQILWNIKFFEIWYQINTSIIVNDFGSMELIY